MVHYYLLLAHWISLWYTTSPIDPLAILMVHFTLLLAHWLSLWYTTIFYWHNGYLFGTLPSPTGPRDISIVHYYFLLARWISVWYNTLSYWQSLLYTLTFFWPTGNLNGTLPSLIDPLAISNVHSYLLLAHCMSLWYTPLPY